MSMFGTWIAPVAAAAVSDARAREIMDGVEKALTETGMKKVSADVPDTFYPAVETAQIVDQALAQVREEIMYALGKFPPYNSLHEAYGVIAEEFDEFFDEVRANDTDAAIEEATQVAATAVRVLIDLHLR